MPLLKIRTIPDPVLKQRALPAENITAGIIALADDMVATMRHFRHCVGIAAPQVGEGHRLIVVDVSLYHKPFPNHGLLVLINPLIKNACGRRPGREGCLSIPDFTGNVTRSDEVTVEGTALDGKPAVIEASGFEAVVLQHEIDHLDGILFLDRVSSLKTDVFRRKNK